MKKVELLAPAGNYESFIGAVNAGADAVYLGGPKFGARALADNFSQEEVCRAIDYAHLFGKKVYLTVNTLVKEKEMGELYTYIMPYYQAGLDAVIIQDLGVFAYIKRTFPGMDLHVSTQMTITGAYGAKFMKEQGADRIVPARELSLEEIREIKQTVPIEIETFIHGAMCYSYSGQCLFSSILGGRSGNRGRCAQPCRLPYRVIHEETAGRVVKGREEYPLSLKDMCTLEMLPQLIDAGIDSLKIEGRMKKPEYTAGVTAVYRDTIDRYYESLRKGKPEAFRIETKDLETLGKLYIRSEQQDGYYRKHNGREMVTLSRPGYTATDEALLSRIRERYLLAEKKQKLTMDVVCKAGELLKLSLHTAVHTTVHTADKSITVLGETVEEAKKTPTTKADIKKQLSKLGNTYFTMDSCNILLEEQVFVPVKELNELRRRGIEALLETLLTSYRRIPSTSVESAGAEENKDRIRTSDSSDQRTAAQNNRSWNPEFCCEVTSMEQYHVLNHLGEVDRIYLPGDCLIDSPSLDMLLFAKKTQIFLALPFILRKRDKHYLEGIKKILEHSLIDGVLFKNLEGLQWLLDIGFEKEKMADAGLYVWNRETAAFFTEQGISYTAPYELNRAELRALSPKPAEAVIYGKLPLMVTANCVTKTCGECRAGQSMEMGQWKLKDRMNKDFQIRADCVHCCNVIYNSLPLSLHMQLETLEEWKISRVRLLFTTEKPQQAAETAQYFLNVLRNGRQGEKLPYQEYTNGHFKRGVE